MSNVLTRRFRRLVTNPFTPTARRQMIELLGELDIELHKPRHPTAFRRIQRQLLSNNKGHYDGDGRLAAALSDLGLGNGGG